MPERALGANAPRAPWIPRERDAGSRPIRVTILFMSTVNGFGHALATTRHNDVGQQCDGPAGKVESEAFLSTVVHSFIRGSVRRMIMVRLGSFSISRRAWILNPPQRIVENYPDRAPLSAVPAGNKFGSVKD
jgi:hypothetical protein